MREERFKKAAEPHLSNSRLVIAGPVDPELCQLVLSRQTIEEGDEEAEEEDESLPREDLHPLNSKPPFSRLLN